MSTYSPEIEDFLWEVAVELGGEVVETLPASCYTDACLPVNTCWWSDQCVMVPFWRDYWKENPHAAALDYPQARHTGDD